MFLRTFIAVLLTWATVAVFAQDSGVGGNGTPFVNAGADQLIAAGATANLSGRALDDGKPLPTTLTIAWTKVSGPGSVTFGTPAVDTTTAAFSTAGVYILRLSANDGAASASDDVRVEARDPAVNQPPVITPPATISVPQGVAVATTLQATDCLLYTSDAADDM
jgi:hypothetical protein